MKYKHKKSQGVYEVVCHAVVEATLEAVVVYRSIKNPVEVWVRPIAEFYDGRFEPVHEVKIA